MPSGKCSSTLRLRSRASWSSLRPSARTRAARPPTSRCARHGWAALRASSPSWERIPSATSLQTPLRARTSARSTSSARARRTRRSPLSPATSAASGASPSTAIPRRICCSKRRRCALFPLRRETSCTSAASTCVTPPCGWPTSSPSSGRGRRERSSVSTPTSDTTSGRAPRNSCASCANFCPLPTSSR